MLSVRQVAACLSVSTATVYRLIAQGALTHVRVSNAVRMRPQDVEAWIAARATALRRADRGER